jgi:hypothetical protein
VILDPATGQLTDYAKNYIAQQATMTAYWNNPATGDPGSCSGTGCPVPFWSQNTSTSSQWGVVDLSEGQGNGGALVACAVSSCLQSCTSPAPLYKCGDPLAEIKTGQNVGQIYNGLADLIGQSGSTPSNYYIDTTRFNNSGTVQMNVSPSIMTVVVWDCTSPLGVGTQPTISVIGYARVFVNEVGKNNASSIFMLDAVGCNNTQSTVPGAVPIRLVNI